VKTIALLIAATTLAVTAVRSFAEDAKPNAKPNDRARPGQQVERSFTTQVGEGDDAEEVTLRYWLFLPEGYGQEKDQKWPLMLFLHGAGERGDDLELVKVHGPPKIVQQRKDFPFIVVSPQCPKGKSWTSYSDTLVKLVDSLAGELAVDTSRMYCTGLSMGGFGTWALAAAHPKLFAAAVPICGGGNPKKAEKLKDLPIWCFHGGKDTVVPTANSEKMIEAIKAAGGNPKLTIYPDAGHDSWTATYDNEEVYKWLLEHKRKG